MGVVNLKKRARNGEQDDTNQNSFYIHLREDNPHVVTIPPGIPHGAINLSDNSCLLVNAVLRHGKTHPKDYQPIKKPFAYNLDFVKKLTNSLEMSNIF